MPAPYVQAFLELPRLGNTAIIDTGADNTCIHPGDILKLAIDYRRLSRTNIVSSSGIGGTLKYHREQGYLHFTENTGDLRICAIDVHICNRASSKVMQTLPSIIGRDFINLCNFCTDKSSNLVQLAPLNVSGVVILPP